MSYVLDTDILIYFLNEQPTVVEAFSNQALSELATTRINATELLYGARNSANPERNLAIHRSLLAELQILDFTAEAAEIYAEEKAWLRQKGKPLADMDMLIASICLAESRILVTNNIRHFERIRGLELENWSE